MSFQTLIVLTCILGAIVFFFGRTIKDIYFAIFPAQRNDDRSNDWAPWDPQWQLRQEAGEHQKQIIRKKLRQDREALELEMDLAHQERLREITSAGNKHTAVINPTSENQPPRSAQLIAPRKSSRASNAALEKATEMLSSPNMPNLREDEEWDTYWQRKKAYLKKVGDVLKSDRVYFH